MQATSRGGSYGAKEPPSVLQQLLVLVQYVRERRGIGVARGGLGRG
jgi:hypothetical protein